MRNTAMVWRVTVFTMVVAVAAVMVTARDVLQPGRALDEAGSTTLNNIDSLKISEGEIARRKRSPEEKDICQSLGGVRIGSQCLTFSVEELNWYDASAACTSKGGQLASLSDIADEALAYVLTNYDSAKFWVGGSDASNEGSWEWLNGEPFNQIAWTDNNPNNWDDNEDCLELSNHNDPNHDGYNDAPCTVKRRYICDLELCPLPWVRIGATGCFQFVITAGTKTWDDARQHCQNIGGDLAVLDVRSKRVDILNYLELHNELKDRPYWLGGTARSGSWQWITGDPVTAGWNDGGASGHEPDNNKGDNCVVSFTDRAYGTDKLMYDWGCENFYYFICEK